MKDVALVTSPEPAFNERKVSLHISKMLSDNFNINIITGGEWSHLNSNVDISVHIYDDVKYDFLDVRWTYHVLCKHIEKHNVDIAINVSQVSTTGLGVALFGVLNEVTTVIRFTGDANHSPLAYSGILKKISKGISHNLIPLFVASFADYCVALGPNYHELLTNIKPKNRVHIIPQPVREEKFRNVPKGKIRKIRNELGISDSDKMVLYVGRISWHKGSDILFDVSSRFDEVDQNVQFCLIGEVKENLSVDFSNMSNVHILGTIENDKIHSYYAAADMFMLPSRAEGLPNVILEALSAELPIIASPVGEVEHYISRIAKEVSDYVDFISSPNLPADNLPSSLEWSNLKKRYVSFFELVSD